ncbi:MAG TPA: GNAT family N-acetyltransferase [Candidatus Binatia bacterium]|nr:GNAT family N-acetyltransferase [Candidatus Binatia bacterium]
MAVEVRRVEDAPEFAELRELLAAYEADLPPELRHGAVPELDAIAQVYAGENAAFVARRDGVPIGCVAAGRFDASSAVLMRLFVLPSARGIGAARALVNAAISFARGRGDRRIVLDTHKGQLVAAYRLYRSLGFEECEPIAPVSYECPTFMELRIEEQADDRI